ncbi:hypothetical protein RSAG8_13158, partial [Rhizoctonia solani AG-8 WAC10335]
MACCKDTRGRIESASTLPVSRGFHSTGQELPRPRQAHLQTTLSPRVLKSIQRILVTYTWHTHPRRVS